MTDNLQKVEHDKTHARIVRTRGGGYEIELPTNFNNQLEPYDGLNFDVQLIETEEKIELVYARKKKPEKESAKTR